MLSALRSAAGSPVSFSELRDAGVQFPASIVSELELSGVAIERCRINGGRQPGVRLAPAAEQPVLAAPAAEADAGPVLADPVHAAPAPVAEAPPTGDDWSRVLRYRASSREGMLLAVAGSRRLLAPVALLVAIAAAVLIIVSGSGHGAVSTPPREPIAQRSHASTRPATTTTHAATTTTRTAPVVTTTPVSLALATQLESQGHDLLTNGQYNAAVPVLRRALAATGENVGGCLEPDSTMCLTYAYALYDLGRALRLSGDPAAAVPVLERRLQIDNQRPTVMAELALARQGAT